MRIESTTRTRASARRRSANPTTAADAASSHWTSSIATTTSPSVASSRSSEPKAVPSSLRSGGLGASILNSATSSAARCGGGSEATRSAGTDESRSDSPANESFTSDSVDEVARTQTPCACARRMYSRQTVVFPIPGSPSISSPAGSAPFAARDASILASSTSRPTTDDDTPTASHGEAETAKPGREACTTGLVIRSVSPSSGRTAAPVGLRPRRWPTLVLAGLLALVVALRLRGFRRRLRLRFARRR